MNILYTIEHTPNNSVYKPTLYTYRFRTIYGIDIIKYDFLELPLMAFLSAITKKNKNKKSKCGLLYMLLFLDIEHQKYV